jgi:hypothetical protein
MHLETTKRILDLMRATFPSGPFKEFYDGDPDEIPTFNLPCIVVDQTKDETTKGVRSEDVTDNIIIKVIYNKSNDYTADLDPTDTTNKKMRDIVAARDPLTRGYLPEHTQVRTFVISRQRV